MKILYVPDHLRVALKAAGAEAKDLYSIEKLLSILSPEDVAFYCYLNISSQKVVPAEVRESLPNVMVQDGPNWPGPSTSEACAEFHRVLNEYCMNDNAPQLDLEGRVLTCDVMDENTIQLTHIPCDTCEGSGESPARERLFYDRLIKQLYVHLKFEDLAKLPLFAAYLRASQAMM